MEVFCRRSFKRKNLFWFWPIHIFYRGKHVLILTISMQTWRFLLKRVWSAGAPRIFAPARTPQKPQIFGKGIFAVLLYNLQVLLLLLPNCPPHYILLILSYLELKVYLEREIEREERKIYLVKGLHLVKRSIPSKERAGGCRPPHPPLVKKK